MVDWESERTDQPLGCSMSEIRYINEGPESLEGQLNWPCDREF